MKIITVSYNKTYPTAQYANEKIGVEAIIGENESPEEAIKILKELCDTIHKNNNPHLYQEQHNYVPDTHVGNILQQTEPQSITPLTQEQKILNLVNQATSIVELEQWKLLSNNTKYPSLKNAYEQKFLELSK